MTPKSADEWVVVQVRSKSEQMVETLLRHKGYETWAPCLPCAASGRKAVRLAPIFPGYVFCRQKEPAHGLVVTTPGVLRFVGPGGHPEAVPASEIAAIQIALSSGLPARPATLQAGCMVEVIAGPLKGCSGVIVEHRSQGLLLIGVSLLQRAVSVIVEGEWLRPLPLRAKSSSALGPAGREVSRVHAAAS